MNTFRNTASKFMLQLYRWTALFVLYGVLFGIVSYVGVMVFYLCSTSWVAPVLISPSNTQILALTETLVTSQQAIDSFTIDRDKQLVTITEMSQQKTALDRLDQELDRAIIDARNGDRISGKTLDALSVQKQSDLAKTEPLVTDANRIEAEIDADLKAGLISKSDAAVQRATLNQFSNTLTDDKVAAVLLNDTVRAKTNTDIPTANALAQRAELRAQIATFAVQITTGQEAAKADNVEIARLQAAMKVAEATPYYRASISPNTLAFAFVPYDNEGSVSVGQPLYDCYVGLVGCYQVGTVERIFPDEEKQQNPIFRTDMRGYLVQITLKKRNAAKSKVLFTHKPFGI